MDTLRYLLQDEVERVYSVSRAEVLKERGIDVPDLYQSVLEFRSGIVASIENNWIVPEHEPRGKRLQDQHPRLAGDDQHGSDQQPALRAIPGNLRRTTRTASSSPSCGTGTWDFAYESIRDFVECLALGRPVQATLEDGLAVTAVVLAIMESAAVRKPVEVRYLTG